MESYALLLAATLNAGTVLAIAALGLLINEKSGIVNLGADSVRNGLADHAAYNAAKGGEEMISSSRIENASVQGRFLKWRHECNTAPTAKINANGKRGSVYLIGKMSNVQRMYCNLLSSNNLRTAFGQSIPNNRFG